eukprot:357531-Chlamydomonas_euryale.AAC.4
MTCPKAIFLYGGKCMLNSALQEATVVGYTHLPDQAGATRGAGSSDRVQKLLQAALGRRGQQRLARR